MVKLSRTLEASLIWAAILFGICCIAVTASEIAYTLSLLTPTK